MPTDLQDMTQELDTILSEYEDLTEQARGFGLRLAGSLDDARAELDDILSEYEDLVDEAEGFGLRLAAYPKGLMPLAKAQGIVKDMAAKVEEMENFAGRIQYTTFDFDRQRRVTVPDAVLKEHQALQSKVDRILAKMRADMGKAEKAIKKYEELLLGANFQSWFEMVRMAVIDLDIPEGIYLDFETGLELNANPPYAYGHLTLEKDRKAIYRVVAGYRAQTDLYWGNLWVQSSGKTFKSVVRSEGRRGLRGDAKTLANQLLALIRANSQDDVVKTRRNVDLDIQDPSITGPLVQAAVMEGVRKRWPWNPTSVSDTRRINLDSSMKTGKGEIEVIEGFKKRSLKSVRNLFEKGAKVYARLEKQFVVEVGADKWKVQLTPTWGGFGVYCLPTGQRNRDFYFWDTFQTPLIWIRDLSRLVYLRRKWDVKVVKVRRRKTSSERVAEQYLTAGAQSCEETVWIADVRQAWREALEEAGAEHGTRGYSGGLYEKASYGYNIVQKEPVSVDSLRALVDKVWSRFDDKWGPAGAIPLLSKTPTKKDKVTVDVKARNEREALRKGGLLIRATGHIPPSVAVQVKSMKAQMKPGGARVKTYAVTGERHLYKRGVAGWHFFGMCSS